MFLRFDQAEKQEAKPEEKAEVRRQRTEGREKARATSFFVHRRDPAILRSFAVLRRLRTTEGVVLLSVAFTSALCPLPSALLFPSPSP
jgi:hypothetical protein